MDKNKLNWLLIGIIGVFTVWTFVIDHKPKSEIKIVTKVDSVYVDKPIYITKIRAKLDTLLVPDIIIKRDTVWKSQIVASADTLITRDSSSAKIKYFFPPLNYFDVDLKLREKVKTITITKEIPTEPSFWDRFGWSIQGGFGYGLINKQFDVYIGLGASFRIK